MIVDWTFNVAKWQSSLLLKKIFGKTLSQFLENLLQELCEVFRFVLL